jgi:hypothetical protein
VRLACLIHAANVRSEPGSNPSVRFSRLVPRTARRLQPSGPENRPVAPPYSTKARMWQGLSVLPRLPEHRPRKPPQPDSRRNPNCQRTLPDTFVRPSPGWRASASIAGGPAPRRRARSYSRAAKGQEALREIFPDFFRPRAGPGGARKRGASPPNHAAPPSSGIAKRAPMQEKRDIAGRRWPARRQHRKVR